jgi:hypothetical protein
MTHTVHSRNNFTLTPYCSHIAHKSPLVIVFLSAVNRCWKHPTQVLGEEVGVHMTSPWQMGMRGHMPNLLARFEEANLRLAQATEAGFEGGNREVAPLVQQFDTLLIEGNRYQIGRLATQLGVEVDTLRNVLAQEASSEFTQ